jgi:hypothetical protein
MPQLLVNQEEEQHNTTLPIYFIKSKNRFLIIIFNLAQVFGIFIPNQTMVNV